MTYLSLNLHALKAANKAASSEETRYYLQGVRVEVTADTITYVATNGHVLFAYQEPAKHTSTEPLLGSWTIPSAVIAKMKCPKYNSRSKLKGDPNYARATFAFEGDVINSQFGDDKHTFKPVDGTYPDWRRVVPADTDPKKPHLNYNPDYLVALKRAGEIMGQSLNYGNFNMSYNGEGPALITYSSVENAFAVIMPYRADTAAKICPAWVYSKAA